MSVSIIVVDYHDLEQSQDLVYLLDQYARDPMGNGKGIDEDVKQILVPELAKLPHVFSLLAYWEENEKKMAAGFATCFQNFSTWKAKPLINIHDIAVLKNFRGRGIATKLLTRVDNIAAERGCCKVTLEVLNHNIAAQRLYQRHGYSGNSVFWEKPVQGTSL